MQRIKVIFGLFISTLVLNAYAQNIHHNLVVNLNIQERSITVVDSLTIPEGVMQGRNSIAFALNKKLVPEFREGSFDILKMPGNDPNAIVDRYTIRVKDNVEGDLLVPIAYSGMISEEISTGADEYARGFSETTGIITDAGVYLAGSTYWIPSFDNLLLTYDLTVMLRADWNVVSQGERTVNEVNEDVRTVQYQAGTPAEEVYLISAAWTEYEQMAGEVLVQAFLRTPDSALASRYLDATSGYLNMYVDLIGPYPYTKFALVENFWETGFGMPSFTLLGEKIIRFPWILSTSYPHELLHNWWGNSVYVDFGKGNWCEGLTAYMADHLLKEQTGQGAEYRRTTLQKFTDYVNAENDFPVIEFRSRNNSAEEAIGYGKCLMFNHMLRKAVGDDHYIGAYRSFYKENIYHVATFDDILNVFQAETENDLKPFFDQWLLRKGAPSISLTNVRVEKAGDGFELHLDLSQDQAEEPYTVNIPVAVYLEDSLVSLELLSDSRTNSYTFLFPAEPVKVEVDPHFDVFRRLDKAEVPPTLSQVFGSPEALVILPKNSPLLPEYQVLAETWKQTQEAQGKALTIVLDEEIEHLPEEASAWIIGFENKYAGSFHVMEDYRQAFDQDQLELMQTLNSEGSLVYTIPNPLNNAYTLGFIGTNVKPAVPGLTRLLPHYGKYSFLGFEGERPNNVLKGNFPAINSPLFYSIPYAGEYRSSNAVLEPAKALIE